MTTGLVKATTVEDDGIIVTLTDGVSTCDLVITGQVQTAL